MSDHGFELQLQRIFDQPPSFPDSSLFAARVRSRLDRNWALRRLLITAAGLAGGGIAAAQFMSVHLLTQADAITTAGRVEAHRTFTDMVSRLTAVFPVLHALPNAGEAGWLVAALAILAAAFVATRVLENS